MKPFKSDMRIRMSLISTIQQLQGVLHFKPTTYKKLNRISTDELEEFRDGLIELYNRQGGNKR